MDLGDDPGETAALLAIDFGRNGTVVTPNAPGDGIVLQTISPTPVPTAVPLTPSPSAVSVFCPRRRYSERGGRGEGVMEKYKVRVSGFLFYVVVGGGWSARGLMEADMVRSVLGSSFCHAGVMGWWGRGVHHSRGMWIRYHLPDVYFLWRKKGCVCFSEMDFCSEV